MASAMLDNGLESREKELSVLWEERACPVRLHMLARACPKPRRLPDTCISRPALRYLCSTMIP